MSGPTAYPTQAAARKAGGPNSTPYFIGGKWYVGTSGTTTNTVPVAGSGLNIPPALIKQYGLKNVPQIIYTPPKSTGKPAGAPTTGRELYAAIGTLQGVPEALKQELITQFFGKGFTPATKRAATIFGDVGTQMAYAGYDLSKVNFLTLPGGSGKNTGVVTPIMQYRQSAQLAQEQMNLAQSQATASREDSAYAVVTNYLDQWGLSSDAPYVYRMIMHQGEHLIQTDAILNAVRGNAPSGLGLSIDKLMKANYEKALPGLDQYNRQPGAIHMNENAYLQYTQQIMNSATQFGAPMPGQKDIGTLLNGHVSPVEYQQRVTDIFAAVSNADPNVKAILKSEYGVDSSHLMAYFANPKNALQDMQRQVASSEIQDYAKRVGLNGLGQSGGEQLANMAKLQATQGNNQLGYGVGQIENSLLGAARDSSLTARLPGAGGTPISTNTLIAAALPGFNGQSQVASQIEVARAEQAAAAPFEKGGGYEETGKGVIGVGAART